MAPLSEQRLTKLQGILQRENSKQTKLGPREPSKFRETWGDTHQRLPAEYFGPPLVEGLAPPGTLWGSSSLGGSSTGPKAQSAPGGSRSQQRKAASQSMGPPEFRSVFQPTPAQQHVCGMSTERRKRIQNSEWALLDMLEVAMYNDEREHRHRMALAIQEQQRHALDTQVAFHNSVRQQEARDLVRERELVSEQVSQYKDEERRKVEAQRERNVTLRRERQTLMAASMDQKRRAAEAARREEEAILAEAQRQLENERQRAAAKAEERKVQNQRLKEENDGRIRARQAAEQRQKEVDELLMKETIKTLEKQEKDREAALKAFQAMIAERGARAGVMAVAENRAREERVERLAKLAEEQKEREHQERERKEKERKEKQKQELLKAREAAAMIKELKEQQQKEELRKLKEESEQRAKLEKEAEDRKMRGIRERSLANSQYVKGQITTREVHNVLDDTCMSEQERRLNLRLLEQADVMVGPVPTMLSVKW